MSIAFRLDVAALTAQLQADATAIAESVRPAAQAGAQVLYEEVQRNVGRIKPHTGNLARSVYQVHSDRSGHGVEVYHVSWNAKRAPHGHLVEYGHIQRYELARDARGRIFPMVRPEMVGKPKPGRRASQAAKDAYWVPRKGGPIQVAARPFVRPAMAKSAQALEAAQKRLFAELEKRGVVR